MMNTWLIRRAVRSPIFDEVTSRMSSSVCRLPFISTSPFDAWISSTAFAAAASLCGTSTISKRSMSRRALRATAAILPAGPTRIGVMMPASAASIGPRSDVSSQGCTTIVLTGGTCLARAMRRSYFDALGGAGPTADSALMSLIFSARDAMASSLSSSVCGRVHAAGASIDDVITAVDIERLAGDQFCGIVRKKRGRGTDVVDADQAARRRFGFRLVEQRVEFRNSRRRACRERPGRDRMHADALGAELGRDVANGGFERRFGDAHDVVVLHHHLAAVIGHGEQRAAFAHQRLRQVRHADEGPARDVHGGEKPFLRHVDDTAAERVLRREGDRVHDEIQFAPLLLDRLKHRLHLSRNAGIERQQDRRFELPRERLDEFPGLVVEVSHRKLGSEGAKSARASPRDRILVGDADHEPLLAFEELRLHGGDLGCAVAVELALLEQLIGNAVELVEGLAAALAVGHMRDDAAVYAQTAFAPGRNVDFKPVAADDCGAFLPRRALAGGQRVVRLPVQTC